MLRWFKRRLWMVCRLILSLSRRMVWPPEVDVGRCEVGDALVVSQMVVVGDEVADLGLELARQIVVLEQDAVLERLMPSLDLALGHRMIRGAAVVLHFSIFE